jgi:uncharacterized repeat protein (TIGR01451 family)
MKNRIRFIPVLGLLSSLFIMSPANAQIDAFTFFVPYPADLLDDQFNAAHSDNFIDIDIVTTISISVQRSRSIIYYDHWEDGLESNIFLPVQLSTEVWGDENPVNGVPPNIPDDVLTGGDVITLQNAVVVPRDRGDLFYDGGDKIVSRGGTIAVTLAVWPDFPDDILFAGAWEIYPTSSWDTNYVIPVGQNVPRPNNGFGTVGLNVQAAIDGTTVNLDLNADGAFENTVVLDEGGQFSHVNGVMAGAHVTATAPVQVHVFTGDPLEPGGQYEARAYTIMPLSQWANDYLAPRSSDGDYWLFNPDPANPLVVQVQTITGTTAITIPPYSTGRYPPLPRSILSTSTGARFTSPDGRYFYGVVALDDDFRQDWGYPLLPTDNHTTQDFVGWAPGNNNRPPDGDESRVYVTAATTTTVFADYNNDEIVDASFTVSPLAEVPITDPADHDLAGTRLYTSDYVLFVAVWGQDQNAPSSLPSIDVGTDIVPLPPIAIQKSYTVTKEGYSCGTVARPYTVDFQLQVYNTSVNPVPDVVVLDELPPGVSYLLGSTVVGGQPVPDDGSGTPFPLDESGYTIANITARGMISISYAAFIEGEGVFTNRVDLVSPQADPAIVDVTIPFGVTGYDVAKVLVDPPDGQATAGQVITFNISITNAGTVTITHLPLRDEFDENYLTFRSASITPSIVGSGVITWTDLTSVVGELSPMAIVNLAASFGVDDVPPEVTDTVNIVLGEDVQGSDGRVQMIICDEARVRFVQPSPTPTASPTPRRTKTPTPTPTNVVDTPTPPQTQTPIPTLTPTPAVLILPETGSIHPSAVFPWRVIGLTVLGFLLAWVGFRRKR